jgi:hypothetical protein
MRLGSKVAWVLALVVLAIAGCNEVVTPPETVSLPLVVETHVSPLCEQSCEKKALEGVEVCEVGTTNCVVTDARGGGTLVLPAGEEVSWTFQKAGYESSLIADVTDASFPRAWEQTVWSDERSAEWYQYLGSEYPLRGVGTVVVEILNPAIDGATFNLIGATGTPFYGLEPPKFFPAFDDLELEATTSAGSGGFLNVAPGDWQIQVGGTAEDCFPLRAWPGDAPNRVRFRVREGHITSVQMNCSAP